MLGSTGDILSFRLLTLVVAKLMSCHSAHFVSGPGCLQCSGQAFQYEEEGKKDGIGMLLKAWFHLWAVGWDRTEEET